MQFRPRLRPFLAGCTLLLALLALGARAGAWHWSADLLALLADSYIGLGLLLLAAWLGLKAWRWAVLAALVLAVSGQQLLGYPTVAPAASSPSAEGSELRLLVYNIYYLNGDLDGVVATVRQYDPDVVFLMEYSETIQGQIETQFADYPYRLVLPSRFTMGLALFSRLPFAAQEVRRAQETRIPVYHVELTVDGQRFSFVGGHPWPPQPQWGQLHRNQMQAITTVAASAAHPLIVAGDFNAAPWAFTVQHLAQQAGVRPVQGPFAIPKTWQPLPLFGLPLDHVLVSDEWQVQALTYGAPGGSDHLPLVLDLRLKEIAETPR